MAHMKKDSKKDLKKDSKKHNKEKKMDISFWVDIDKNKTFIKTTIDKAILKKDEEFDKFIVDIMNKNNGIFYIYTKIKSLIYLLIYIYIYIFYINIVQISEIY